jgi:hypothetical protein
MKNFVFISLFVVILLLSGCVKALLVYNGVHNPTFETHKSLSRFLVKQDIDTVGMLCFRDSSSFFEFIKQKFGSPNVQFFNNCGKFVDYRSSATDCNAKVSAFIERLDSINTMPADTSKSIESSLAGTVWSVDHTDFKLEKQPYDAYMVIYWAKYLGRVNKSHIVEWQKLAADSAHKGLKIKILSVSTDFQLSWGMNKSDLPKLKY